jgi:hypothetical protein
MVSSCSHAYLTWLVQHEQTSNLGCCCSVLCLDPLARIQSREPSTLLHRPQHLIMCLLAVCRRLGWLFADRGVAGCCAFQQAIRCTVLCALLMAASGSPAGPSGRATASCCFVSSKLEPAQDVLVAAATCITRATSRWTATTCR